jgi:hypothetical protein
VTCVPTSGSIAFVPPNCDVLDSTGKSISPTKTPTSISFKVAKGASYHLRILYDLEPVSATGELREDCVAKTLIDTISATSNPEVYTIVGV